MSSKKDKKSKQILLALNSIQENILKRVINLFIRRQIYYYMVRYCAWRI